MRKLIYIFMLLFLAAGVMASNEYLEIQIGGGYANITYEGNTNKISCWDSNYFKYKLSAECNSNAVNSALNSCQTELSNLINSRNNFIDELVDENKELRANNTYLINKVNDLQNNLNEKTNKVIDLESGQDTDKTDKTVCEKDLAVCKTERDNEKDNSFLNIIQNIFIGGLIAIAVITCFIIKFRKDKGDENNCGQNIPEKRPAKDLDNSF